MEHFNDFFGNSDDDNEEYPDFENLYTLVSDNITSNEYKYIEAQELEEAIDYFIIENIDKALKINDYALQIFPDNVNFLFTKAEILIDLNKNPEARELLDIIEDKEPYNADAYLLRVSMHINEGKIEQAIAECHRALINDIEDISDIYTELGYCYKTLKKYKDALKCYQKSIEIEKSNPDPYYSITDIYIQTGQISEGLFYFDKLILEDTHNINALFAMGKLFAKKGIYKRALQTYNKVLRIDNTHFDALFEKISIYKKQNNYQKVIELCNIYKDAFFPFFLFELAKTYSELDYNEEALAIYKDLYQNDPEDFDKIQIITGITYCYMQMGMYNKAISFIESGLISFPYSNEILIAKAAVLNACQRSTEAMEIITAVIECSRPEIFSEIELSITEILMEMGAYKDALNYLEMFSKSDPFNATMYYLMAAAYYLSFEKNEAYDAFEKALNLSGNDYGLFFEKCMIAHTDNTIYELLEKYSL